MLKKIFFSLDPELSHSLALQSLRAAHFCGLTKFISPISSPLTVMGLSFPNLIGLAAGLDKNGDYIDALAALGFGFIEVGTVTPKPQLGNPKPRLFRLVKHEALINRMGFNNKGVDYLVRRLGQTKFKGILGINIGKNADTPIENAIQDYVTSFELVYPFASYVTINISSPNTPLLRDLQRGELLKNLLSALKKLQTTLAVTHKKYVPLVVKVAPDLESEEIVELGKILLEEKIDGVIATNTTVSRRGVENSFYAKESGGLSGKPLAEFSTLIIQQLKKIVGNNLPIIACGGVSSAKDVREKIQAGASLVQLYTGLIYQGPGLIRSLTV